MLTLAKWSRSLSMHPTNVAHTHTCITITNTTNVHHRLLQLNASLQCDYLLNKGYLPCAIIACTVNINYAWTPISNDTVEAHGCVNRDSKTSFDEQYTKGDKNSITGRFNSKVIVNCLPGSKGSAKVVSTSVQVECAKMFTYARQRHTYIRTRTHVRG